eukprot:6469257-Amphidinium_carterae.1
MGVVHAPTRCLAAAVLSLVAITRRKRRIRYRYTRNSNSNRHRHAWEHVLALRHSTLYLRGHIRWSLS